MVSRRDRLYFAGVVFLAVGLSWPGIVKVCIGAALFGAAITADRRSVRNTCRRRCHDAHDCDAA